MVLGQSMGTRGSFQYVATYRVTKAPDHGQLAMGEVNKRTRVAYKPDAGFVGEDRYTLMDTTSNSQRLVAVTVIPKGDPPSGGWPVMAWAHGTTGMADICAPSWKPHF